MAHEVCINLTDQPKRSHYRASTNAAPALTGSVTRVPTDVRVRVSGDLDIATAPKLDRELQMLQHEGHHRFVLDLEHLEFIDARGFAALARAKLSVQRFDGRVTILHCKGQVRHFFEVIETLGYLALD